MPLHPELLELQQRLTRVGTIAVAYPDYLEIRLSLFSTVRVRYEAGQLAIEPFFGFVPRGRATLMTTTLVTLGTGAIFLLGGATPATFALAFLGVLSRVYEAMRYVVTEACITRVQMLWDAHPGSNAQPSIQADQSIGALGAPMEVPIRQSSRAASDVRK
jgi:hypothetical protein